MKKLLPLLGLAVALSGPLAAQPPAPEPAIAAAARFDAGQLEQLVGPIALYPDALVALILPASTNSLDVVLAARFLRAGGDPTREENESWDESVRALARYPDIVRWMDDNLAWTKQLGEAFTAQPAEVMNAIQRLRAKARANGALASSTEQVVLVEQSRILIVPAQPDVIYIPYYNPGVIYEPGFRSGPSSFIRFGPGYRAGFWLSYALDWGSLSVCFVAPHDRERFWRERPASWRAPFTPHHPSYHGPPVQVWTPRYYRSPTRPPERTVRPPTELFRAPDGSVTERDRPAPKPDANPSDANRRHGRGMTVAQQTAPGTLPASSATYSTAPATMGPTSLQPSTNPPLPLMNPLPQGLSSPLPQAMPAPLPAASATTAVTPGASEGPWKRASSDATPTRPAGETRRTSPANSSAPRETDRSNYSARGTPPSAPANSSPPRTTAPTTAPAAAPARSAPTAPASAPASSASSNSRSTDDQAGRTNKERNER